MKKLSISAFVLSNLIFAASAIAAQDTQVTSDQMADIIKNLKLPLDHGPRAVVTPWVNQQRRLRAIHEIQVKLAAHDSRGASDSDK
jgi:hypothetical protein